MKNLFPCQVILNGAKVEKLHPSLCMKITMMLGKFK